MAAQDTITIAFLIPIVAVACRFCRNRPAVQHVLWAVVLVKFMMPPLVCWPVARAAFLCTVLWSKPEMSRSQRRPFPWNVSRSLTSAALAEAGSGTSQKELAFESRWG